MTVHISWVRFLVVAAFFSAVILLAPGRGSAQEETVTPTFAKDVLPVLQRSCQQCHRPGSVAPMSLLTYEDTRPWARAIRDRTAQREMPPWYIERNVGVGAFKEDPSLSDVEIEMIRQWVDAGAPRGDDADAPPPLELSLIHI